MEGDGMVEGGVFRVMGDGVICIYKEGNKNYVVLVGVCGLQRWKYSSTWRVIHILSTMVQRCVVIGLMRSFSRGLKTAGGNTVPLFL